MHSWKETEDTTGCGSAIAAIYPHQREQPRYQINEYRLRATRKMSASYPSFWLRLIALSRAVKDSRMWKQQLFERRISIFRDLGFILIKLVPWIKFGWEEGGEEVWKGKEEGLGLSESSDCLGCRFQPPTKVPSRENEEEWLKRILIVFHREVGSVNSRLLQLTPAAPWL